MDPVLREWSECSEGTRSPVFECRRLTKFYGKTWLHGKTRLHGKMRGVEDVSLAVGKGEIFGLLGPNGAGKTTIIRTAMGFLGPSSGEVQLFGRTVRQEESQNRERIGYLPADLRLWPRLTARRISDLLIDLGRREADRDWRDELAARLGLDLDRKVKQLSLGNRQKIGLLLAMQHRPDLLILDEATSGLDPLVRRQVLEILRGFAARGGTVIYSSHNLNEVEDLCSRVGILRRGTLAALKTIEEIRAEREQRLEFVFKKGSTVPEGLAPDLSRFKLTKTDGATWEVRFHGSPDPLLRWLAQYELAEITSPQVSLEEAFLGYYRDDLLSSSERRQGAAQVGGL